MECGEINGLQRPCCIKYKLLVFYLISGQWRYIANRAILRLQKFSENFKRNGGIKWETLGNRKR